MKKYFDWRVLASVGLVLLFLSASVFVMDLMNKATAEEKKNVENYVSALKALIGNGEEGPTDDYASQIILKNTQIPLILVDENSQILESKNIDTNVQRKNILREKLLEFHKLHDPVIIKTKTAKQLVYYGDTNFLSRLRLAPYVMAALFLAVFGFLIVTIISIKSNRVISWQEIQN
jgi:hypothetical protein